MNESLDFSPYLERWALQPDGEPFATHSSRLLPVRHRGAAAMLKISSAEEERFGHVLLNWWNGQGAARVLAYDHQALLMERATGGRSLLEMVGRGDDDEATRILCQAIERIHAPRPGPLPELIPLERWFDSLYAAERRYGGIQRVEPAAGRRPPGPRQPVSRRLIRSARTRGCTAPVR